MTTTVTADEVILLSDDGQPIGRADRTQVHTADTPLHLAFSTYLFNERGEVLLTREGVDGRWSLCGVLLSPRARAPLLRPPACLWRVAGTCRW